MRGAGLRPQLARLRLQQLLLRHLPAGAGRARGGSAGWDTGSQLRDTVVQVVSDRAELRLAQFQLDWAGEGDDQTVGITLTLNRNSAVPVFVILAQE